jgi:hypothetical protein
MSWPYGLVDRAPQEVDRAIDPDDDFIEMPLVASRARRRRSRLA